MKAKLLVCIVISIILFSNLVNISYAEINNQDSDDSFDSEIKSLMRLGRFPSVSTCIIKNSSVVWYRGYGYSKTYKKIQPTEDTIYLTGSISKSITAVAILQLFDKGLLNLTDDVNDYLDFNVRHPNYPDVPITFELLLSHQASFGRQDFKQLLQTLSIALFKEKEYPYPIIKDIITGENKFYSIWLWEDSRPGDEYHYSCYDYVLLEHLVEKISNETFEEYCRENIFQPLEMNNTDFNVSYLDDDLLATPYFHLVANLYLPIPQFNGEGIAGVGGMRSSVGDLANYLIMHMNNGSFKDKQILNESTAQLMHTVRYPNLGYNNRSAQRYGLGWEVFHNMTNGVTFSGHTGNTPGSSSIIMMAESSDVGFIVLINKQVWFFVKLIPILCWAKILDLIELKTLEYS